MIWIVNVLTKKRLGYCSGMLNIKHSNKDLQ